jgi:release factor glutamine methyltransferase
MEYFYNMTIRETLREGKVLLSSARIESAALDAALLLADILRTDKAGLIIRGNETIAEDARSAFLNVIRRRMAGEPVAYILGRKEFRGLDFIVSPDVLVPRPDTETLVEAALLKAREKSFRHRRLLDLCTGSGAVAVALKHELPDWEIWASDISSKALNIARANAKKILGSPGAVHFVHSDLFDAFDCGLRFSLIVTNPPYVQHREIGALPPEVRIEPRIALDGGEDGLDLIRRIIPQLPYWLSGGGSILIEAAPGQMEAVAMILREHEFLNPELHKDLAGRERVVSASRFP